MQPGDTLFAYTDGITEAEDTKENDFGEDRLKECLVRGRDLPTKDLLDSVISEVQSFSDGVPQSDDITCLAVKYIGR